MTAVHWQHRDPQTSHKQSLHALSENGRNHEHEQPYTITHSHVHFLLEVMHRSNCGFKAYRKRTEKSWWRPISVDYQLQRISRSGLNRIALFCLQMVLCLPAGGRGRKKKAECHFLFRPRRSTKGGWWLRSISWRWQVDENVTLISQNPKQALFAPPQCSSSQILTQFRIIWLENSADAFIRDIGCG